jgi:hypothetical protein
VRLAKAEKIIEMLKQVQDDMTIGFFFYHPELASGSRFILP